jgi:hypothetical protein
MFDFEEDADRERERAERQAKVRAEFAAWLQSLAQGGCQPWTGSVPGLDPDLRTALLAAQQQGNALGRLQLYRLLSWREDLRDPIDPLAGLRDPDPAVRFFVLEQLSPQSEVAPELQAALRQDPGEATMVSTITGDLIGTPGANSCRPIDSGPPSQGVHPHCLAGDPYGCGVIARIVTSPGPGP